MKYSLFIILLVSINLYPQTEKQQNDWKSFYDKYNVSGCILIYDLNKSEYIVYNGNRCKESFIPASTFKILNSLIALETGVIKDENEVIPWDSVKRQYDKWNMDQTLRTAIKYSAVWAYQELARRIGEHRMQHYVDSVKYGNCNISGGIDHFWLDGELRITPFQQVEFLKRLYFDDLPFSKRNLDIVKDIMINDQTGNYILRGKTGWVETTGWYVGYLEENDNVYFFANNIEIVNDRDAKARLEIVKDVFKSMGLLK
jgi:beta-lactamase class D